MYGSCGAKSPSNFNITNNRIKIDTENMAYGITYLSYGVNGTTDDYDMPLTATFPLNVYICDNNVVINSKKGAIGIGGQCYNMTVSGNDVTVIAGSPEDVETSDMLGKYSCVFLVQYNDLNEDDVTYEHINDYKIFIENNKAVTNVTGEIITDTDYLEYVTFDNNIFKIQDDEGNFIVTPETFDVFFDEKTDLPKVPVCQKPFLRECSLPVLFDDKFCRSCFRKFSVTCMRMHAFDNAERGKIQIVSGDFKVII